MNAENTLFKIEKKITRIEKKWIEFAHIVAPALTILLGIFSLVWGLKISIVFIVVIPTICVLIFRKEIGNGKIVTFLNFTLLLMLMLALKGIVYDPSILNRFLIIALNTIICVISMHNVPKEICTIESLLDSK